MEVRKNDHIRPHRSISLSAAYYAFAAILAATVTVYAQHDPFLEDGLVSLPDSVVFGSTEPGTPVYRPITLYNRDTAQTYTITAVEPANAAFGFETPPSLPLVLAPGDTAAMELVFAPVAVGVFEGAFRFLYNGGSDTLVVAVQGSSITQGGILQFARETRVLYDNQMNIVDTIRLEGYAGENLVALQTEIVNTNPLVRFAGAQRGTAIGDSAAWMFMFDVRHGTLGPDYGSLDTISVVILSFDLAGLPPGTYDDLFRIEYHTANIPVGSDTASFEFRGTLGSLQSGGDAFIEAGAPQIVVIENSVSKGDVTSDDRLDINDIIATINYILGKRQIHAFDFHAADIAPWPSGDGAVNIRDLALMNTIIIQGHYPDGRSSSLQPPLPF